MLSKKDIIEEIIREIIFYSGDCLNDEKVIQDYVNKIYNIINK